MSCSERWRGTERYILQHKLSIGFNSHFCWIDKNGPNFYPTNPLSKYGTSQAIDARVNFTPSGRVPQIIAVRQIDRKMNGWIDVRVGGQTYKSILSSCAAALISIYKTTKNRKVGPGYCTTRSEPLLRGTLNFILVEWWKYTYHMKSHNFLNKCWKCVRDTSGHIGTHRDTSGHIGTHFFFSTPNVLKRLKIIK